MKLTSNVPAAMLLSLMIGCSSGGSGAGSGTTPTGGGDGGGGGGDTEPANMNGMTAAHNKARANVSPAASPAIPRLVWSNTVAATAQAWANNCDFKHSGGSYGENIFAGSGDYTPDAVVTDWVSESSAYDYASNSCSGVCGHYTQVVWAKSQRLGCGVANCTTNSPFGGGAWQFWVCNYDPPGNFNGEKPY